MKHIFLSLADTKENEVLLKLLNNDPEIRLVDLRNTKENDITVIVNNSLSELAFIIMNDWQIKDRIKEVLFVGGSDKYGDVTPVAEKNVYENPEAAQYIFLSRMHIVMFGLNVTRNIENRAILPYLYLNHEECFDKEECGIYVETKGKVTRGQSVIDIYSDRQFDHHDCELIKKIPEELYKKLLKEI